MATPLRLPKLMVGWAVLVMLPEPEPESCKDKLAKDPSGGRLSTVKIVVEGLGLPGLPEASDKRTPRACRPWLSATLTEMFLAPALHKPALRSPEVTV